MANSKRDGNFVPGGDIGVIQQLDLTTKWPQTVAILDGSGNQITSFGGGTQYTEGDTDTTITGTAAMMEVAANVLQPIQGTVADGLLVNLGGNNDVTVTGSVAVTNAGLTELAAAINVSSQMDVNIAASGATVPVSGTFWQATQPVSLASVPSHDVTNAGTFAVQAASTIADGADVTLGAKTDAKSTATDATSVTAMQVLKQISASVQAPPTQAVTFTGSTDVATQTTLAALNAKVTAVNTGAVVVASGAVTVTNATAANLKAEATIAAAQTLATVTTVGTVTTLTGGGVAHDSADSGNPHKIGLKAYSPDGTTPGTAVAEGDRTDAKGDLDGRLFVNDEHPRWGSYHVDGSSALTDATVAASPGAGFQTVITNICVSSGAATAMNMFLEEGSTKIFGPIYLEAVAGRGFCTPAGFKKHVTAATAVTITTSAAIAHSVDIQYITQAV